MLRGTVKALLALTIASEFGLEYRFLITKADDGLVTTIERVETRLDDERFRTDETSRSALSTRVSPVCLSSEAGEFRRLPQLDAGGRGRSGQGWKGVAGQSGKSLVWLGPNAR